MEKYKNLPLFQKQLHYLCGLKDSIKAELEEAESREPQSCDDENVLNEERVKVLKSRIDELDKIWTDISKKVIDVAVEVTDETKDEGSDKKTLYEEDKMIDKAEGLKWWLEKLEPGSANMLKEIILAIITKGSNRDNEDNRNSDGKIPAIDDKEKKKDDEETFNLSSSDGKRSSSPQHQLSGKGHRSRSRSNARSPDHYSDGYDDNERGKSSQQQPSGSRDSSRSISNARYPVHYRSNYGYDVSDHGVQHYVQDSYPQQHKINSKGDGRGSFNQQLPFTNRPQGQAWKGKRKLSANSIARAVLYKNIKNKIINAQTPMN
ncbi:uncharacterized protein LOC130671369 isoform X2 [Microplitis mediator]|uniref:uncharacterized protein LOC130671369 isoform X2 n=1 Tax=Microplitis mediator TaxID=375433 RepID=UPI00255763E6|nr:uncharacterized protein LOC130671369 isoform X2 [Microplitis mediator]